MAPPVVGVLALQGAFAIHAEVLHGLGVEAPEIRLPAELGKVDALVIPGGESTTMTKMLDMNGLRGSLEERLKNDMPVFGTCAGMILLASKVLDGRPDQVPLGVVDMSVRRNGYGRQIDSFESDLTIDDSGQPFRAVFIRAPKAESVGAGVEVLAEVDSAPVLCRQGSVMVSSFHPELTPDSRIHQMFLDGISS